jgi:hypothetical protein
MGSLDDRVLGSLLELVAPFFSFTSCVCAPLHLASTHGLPVCSKGLVHACWAAWVVCLLGRETCVARLGWFVSNTIAGFCVLID